MPASSGRRAVPLTLAVLLVAQPALARTGTLAVVNADQARHEVVQQVTRSLERYLGGWARQPGVDAFLAGRNNPGALPAGQTGEDLVRLVEQVRSRRIPGRAEMTGLGRLLGVDYLLLVRVEATSLTGRLYSVRRQRYAPVDPFVGQADRPAPLRDYVLRQTRAAGKKTAAKRTRWWLWIAAAGLAALTIGLAVSAGGDETSGDLRIRVSR